MKHNATFLDILLLAPLSAAAAEPSTMLHRRATPTAPTLTKSCRKIRRLLLAGEKLICMLAKRILLRACKRDCIPQLFLRELKLGIPGVAL